MPILVQQFDMKNFLTIALFVLPFFTSAQDSCHLKKETDAFTHQTKVSTGFIPFTANGVQLSVSIDATATDIDFFLWFTAGQKCFDDESTIQINFEGDRIKQNYKNSGSMNCEGAFHFTFKNTPNTPSNLQRLIDKKINTFHITGTAKAITDISFSAEQKQQLQRMIACVVNESKSFLKK
jgi:hypothetical protein